MAEITLVRTTYWYYPEIFLSRIFGAIIGAVEFVLGLRLILELFGANSISSFVAWVYSVSNSLIAPFAGAFDSWIIGDFILNVSVMFAMIGYAIIAWLALQLLSFLSSMRYVE